MTRTAEQDRIEREAARAALDAMGPLGTMPICGECGQVGDHDHSPAISPTMTAAMILALAMVAGA